MIELVKLACSELKLDFNNLEHDDIDKICSLYPVCLDDMEIIIQHLEQNKTDIKSKKKRKKKKK